MNLSDFSTALSQPGLETRMLTCPGPKLPSLFFDGRKARRASVGRIASSLPHVKGIDGVCYLASVPKPARFFCDREGRSLPASDRATVNRRTGRLAFWLVMNGGLRCG